MRLRVAKKVVSGSEWWYRRTTWRKANHIMRIRRGRALLKKYLGPCADCGARLTIANGSGFGGVCKTCAVERVMKCFEKNGSQPSEVANTGSAPEC